MHNKPHTIESRDKISKAKIGIPAIWNRRETIISEVGTVLYKCGKCFNFFPYEGFYKNNRTILGITNCCKKCHCQTSISSRNKENHRMYNREYMRKTIISSPEKMHAIWNARHNPKTSNTIARTILNAAVRSGKLIKPDVCQGCGENKRITAHHHDYSKPLDVIWLCYQCHADVHRGVYSFERCDKPQEVK